MNKKNKNNYFIPQMEPWFDDQEKKAIYTYMEEGGWITEFKKTTEFENMIAKFTKSKHCIVVNNGTISLTLAAIAAGVKPGDEVIVPNYTMIATPNSVKMIGAIPVFVDVEKDSLCLNIELVKKVITNKTKAIILVTPNGRYPNVGIQAFKKLAKQHNLALIEDAAQSLGSFYPNGRHIGSEGIVGSFSFSSPKVISTGQGGALITSNDKIAKKLRKLKDFGRTGGGTDIHDSIGYNFKFTELQACIGIEQMKKLLWRIKRKKEILELYRNLLSSVKEIVFFEQNLQHTTPWFIDILVERRDSLQEFLKSNNIGTRVMYPPINKQKAYKLKGNYPISTIVGKKGLWLPSSAKLTDLEIDYICGKIKEFFRA